MSYKQEIIDGLINGTLKSPTLFDNKYFVVMRITGTGQSTRGDKQTLRSTSDFLDDKFLNDCVGIPITINHPYTLDGDKMETEDLTLKNYHDNTVVGSVIKAFVVGDDVMGVCSILDNRVIPMLPELSTSPAIRSLFTGVGNNNIDLEQYSSFNHLALIKKGTGHWDNNTPAIWHDNIESVIDISNLSIGANTMAEEIKEEKKEEETVESKQDESEDKAKIDEGAGYREADRKDEDVKKKETAAERKEDEGTGFREYAESKKDNDEVEDKIETSQASDFETLKSEHETLKAQNAETLKELEFLKAQMAEIAKEVTVADDEVYDPENEEVIVGVEDSCKDTNTRYATKDNMITIPIAKAKEKAHNYCQRVIALNKNKLADIHRPLVTLCDSKRGTKEDLPAMLQAIEYIKNKVQNVKATSAKEKGCYDSYNANGQPIKANFLD